MKARYLKELLNNTKYNVHNQRKKICVGSPLCSDLIHVYKDTFVLVYALDTWKEGRDSLVRKGEKNNELLFIWDTLADLIRSGEIRDIIQGNDTIENPIPVFTVERGNLVEEVTDTFGYPNITHAGNMMYDNTHFKTKEEAIRYGISEETYGLKWAREKVEELDNKKLEAEARCITHEKKISELEALLK